MLSVLPIIRSERHKRQCGAVLYIAQLKILVAIAHGNRCFYLALTDVKRAVTHVCGMGLMEHTVSASYLKTLVNRL